MKKIMLVDVPVHKTAQELGVTRTSIYTKYTGLSPPRFTSIISANSSAAP